MDQSEINQQMMKIDLKQIARVAGMKMASYERKITNKKIKDILNQINVLFLVN